MHLLVLEMSHHFIFSILMRLLILAWEDVSLMFGSSRSKFTLSWIAKVEGGRGESVVVHSWNHTSRFWVRDPNDILVFSVYVQSLHLPFSIW